MKRHFYRSLLIAFVGFGLAAGCSSKHFMKEEISKSAPSDLQATEVVPDDRVVSDAVNESDLNAGSTAPKLGGKYASLQPGDELSMMAEGSGRLYTIYFDYDRYAIRDSETQRLTTNAEWMKLNSVTKILIEGHADERGETEYNLALGDKRAKSVRKYLETMGVSTKRLSVISYGEEKPAAKGSNEEAWAQNRRAEFTIVN